MYSVTSAAGLYARKGFSRSNRVKRGNRPKNQIPINPSAYITGNMVSINVSGTVYRLHESNLKQYPGTLLGSNKRNLYYDEKEHELFFDRDPYIFKFIHKYYKTGKLHFSDADCYDSFVDELNFFMISLDEIADCCGETYSTYLSKKAKQKKEAEQQAKRVKVTIPSNFREFCWEFSNNPHYSLPAKIFYYVSCLAIIVSLILNTVETVHCGEIKSGNSTLPIRCGDKHYKEFFTVDSVCVSFFTLEYLLRLFGTPIRWKFIKSPMSVIDVLGILPYFIDLALKLFNSTINAEAMNALVVLRSLRIVRVFKLVRHSKRLQDLSKSISNSARELGFILFMYFIVVIIFASIIFYAESAGGGKTDFVSIPQAIWYTVVTTTTTGYGDIVPQTIQGKLIGSVCCLMGVLVIALPVPIIQMKADKVNDE